MSLQGLWRMCCPGRVFTYRKLTRGLICSYRKLTSGLICLLMLGLLLFLKDFHGSSVSVSSRYLEASRLLGNTSRIQTSSKEILHSDDGEENGLSREMTSSELRVKTRFLERHQRLDQYCQKMGNVSYARVNFHKLTGTGLQVCSIPKVGSEFLKSIDRFLRKERLDVNGPKPEKRVFFLVREPYSRMVSGYLGKIVTSYPYWPAFGRYIINYFRSGNRTREEKWCGSDVSFPEFVKYLIDAQRTGKKKNPHFIPIHEHCELCLRHYDFIGHLETVKEDMDYMLKTAGFNISDELNFKYDEPSMVDKIERTISERTTLAKECGSLCYMLERVWWSFQARGMIANDIALPVGPEECETITVEKMLNLTLDAHRRSQSLINKSKQKRDALVKLFLQVPLEDRLKLRDLYQMDFDLFGYDSQPTDLFPELSKQ